MLVTSYHAGQETDCPKSTIALFDVIFTFHFSPRLCPSTAGCISPSVLAIVLCLLLSCSRWFPPSCAKSSRHLLLGRPLDLFPLLGCHSVQRLVHLLSINLAICPVHLHFCLSVHSTMSIISVLFPISEHGFLSRSFKFNTFLFVAL